MSNTIERLEANYRKYAQAHGDATETGDYRKANRNHDQLIKTYKELSKLGDQGKAVVSHLMDCESKAISCWAASHCLGFAEARALDVLDRISRSGGIIAFSAKMTADLWRAGELEGNFDGTRS